MTERKLGTVLAVLCLTEITSWGVLFYAFPVLVPAIARDTGWSPAALTAALSVALLVSALTGIALGRVLDRRGPRLLMTAGSVVGVAAVVVIASTRTLPFGSDTTVQWSEVPWSEVVIRSPFGGCVRG